MCTQVRVYLGFKGDGERVDEVEITEGDEAGRTESVDNNANPCWRQTVMIPSAVDVAVLRVVIIDVDSNKDELRFHDCIADFRVALADVVQPENRLDASVEVDLRGYQIAHVIEGGRVSFGAVAVVKRFARGREEVVARVGANVDWCFVHPPPPKLPVLFAGSDHLARPQETERGTVVISAFELTDRVFRGSELISILTKLRQSISTQRAMTGSYIVDWMTSAYCSGVCVCVCVCACAAWRQGGVF